jgi:dihydrofolate reductase
MRKVIYGAACSLDGFIAGADGAIDWLHFSPEVQAVMTQTWARVDTVLMGRKTYEVAAASGGGGGEETSGIAGYVFSRTLTSVTPPTHLVSSDAVEFVRALKAKKGKDICLLGGGELAQSLFAAGLIDEVGLNVHPVLLGVGVPFFRNAGRIRLRLTEGRMIDGGCALLTYRVVHPRRAAQGESRMASTAPSSVASPRVT